MDNFKKVSMISDKDGAKSMPLVLPNNVKYEPKTGQVARLPGVQRTHLELVPSTVALLSQIREPVAVLSIAGMARSGKSYLLSRMLGSSDAFKLGHSMDPETFGIWIATQVLKSDRFTIILVDTEGIDSASAEKKNDISLLVLTILLSSYFIFNTISVPKRAQLEDLQCFIQLVNSLRVNKEGKEDYNEFSKVFPDFLWLLRDVTLTPTDEKGKVIDARTYLKERLLKPSEGFEEQTSDKVARAIKIFFPSIDCITLPVPSDDADVMQHVETSEGQLTPEFNAGVKKAIQHILQLVKPKSGYVKDTNVTGSQLACMLETYVKAVNDPNTIPIIETTWQTSFRILATRFHNEAVEMYKKWMTAALDAQGKVPMEAAGGGENTLLSVHRKNYTMAQESVRKGLGPMCNEIELTESMSLLQQVVYGYKEKSGSKEESSGLFNNFWRVNYEKSRLYCRGILDATYELIAKKISGNDKDYTYENLKKDLEQLEVDYKAKGKGPAKQNVYADFMEFVNSEAKAFGKVQDFKKEEFAEQQKAAEMSTRIDSMLEERREIESLMVEEMEENRRQAEKLMLEFREKEEKINKEEREAYSQRMAEQAERMQKQMMENVKLINEAGEKNKNFLEETLKMVQQQRKEDREHTLEMIKAMQEKNDKIAKDIAEQVKEKSKSPLEQIGEVVSSVGSFIGVLRPILPALTALKTAGSKKQR